MRTVLGECAPVTAPPQYPLTPAQTPALAGSRQGRGESPCPPLSAHTLSVYLVRSHSRSRPRALPHSRARVTAPPKDSARDRDALTQGWDDRAPLQAQVVECPLRLPPRQPGATWAGSCTGPVRLRPGPPVARDEEEARQTGPGLPLPSRRPETSVSGALASAQNVSQGAGAGKLCKLACLWGMFQAGS